jgi:hypothetical protein
MTSRQAGQWLVFQFNTPLMAMANSLVQQFPHPPGGSPARPIEPIPILATTSSGPLLEDRGIEELAVKVQRCSRALLPSTQAVPIE